MSKPPDHLGRMLASGLTIATGAVTTFLCACAGQDAGVGILATSAVINSLAGLAGNSFITDVHTNLDRPVPDPDSRRWNHDILRASVLAVSDIIKKESKSCNPATAASLLRLAKAVSTHYDEIDDDSPLAVVTEAEVRDSLSMGNAFQHAPSGNPSTWTAFLHLVAQGIPDFPNIPQNVMEQLGTSICRGFNNQLHQVLKFDFNAQGSPIKGRAYAAVTLDLLRHLASGNKQILALVEALREENDKGHGITHASLNSLHEKFDSLPTSAPHPVPHLLPPAADQYFGRGKQKVRLEALLRERKSAYVQGLAGIGKTALAADVLISLFGTQQNELARKLFPQGFVLLDLYLLKADREKVWAALANALAGQDFLKDIPQQSQRAKAACANRDFLLIIEGAEEACGQGDAASLEELCSVLCTQNRRLVLTRDVSQTEPAVTVKIDEALDPEDAASLLRLHADSAIPEQVLGKLLELLEGHPLSLTWAGGLIGQGRDEARDLLTGWTAEKLPKINDPLKPHHTLKWLFGRSIATLCAEGLHFLHGAGQLARAPFPIAAFRGFPDIADADACARALVGVGILRIAGEEGHREFTHVLGYQFASSAQDQTDGAFSLHLAGWLERELRRILFSPGVDSHLPTVTRHLQHSAALLAANPSDTALWRPLANGLLYDFSRRLIALGHLSLARAAISTAADWLKALPGPTLQEPDWQREIAASHSMLGNIAAAQGDLAAARASYTAGLKIAETLAVRDRENTQRQRDLSVSHNKLGDVATAQGDLAAARASYTAGLKIRETLAARDPENTQWQRDLSVSHNRLGDIATAQGDLSAARASYTAGLKIRETLAARDRENTQWQRDLSVSHEKLGDVATAQGDLTAARASYTAGLKIRETLTTRDPENTEWQRDLSISHNRLGDIAAAQADVAAARASYTAYFKIAETLATRDPENTQWQRDLSISHNNLGDIATAQGDLPAARASYTAGLKIAETLAARDSENTQWQRDLFASHWMLADIAEKQGDPTEARRHWQKSHDVLDGIARAGKHVSPEDKQSLSFLKQKLGIE